MHPARHGSRNPHAHAGRRPAPGTGRARRLPWILCAGLAACLCQPLAAAGSGPGFGMSGGGILGGYPAPRTAMLADADGDGRADFVGYYPGEKGIVDFMRMSPLGKPFPQVQAARDMGGGALAAVCGRIPGTDAGALLLLPDGTIRLLHRFDPASQTFSRSDAAGSVPAALMPRGPASATVGDRDWQIEEPR